MPKRKTREQKIREGGVRPLSKYHVKKLERLRTRSVHLREIMADPNLSLDAKDYV